MPPRVRVGGPPHAAEPGGKPGRAPVPVRFGGDTSPEHGLLLRFGPLDPDGIVRGHVLAQVGEGWDLARDAIAWDPALRCFAIWNNDELERLAERLDPVSAALGVAGRVASGIVKAVVGVLSAMLSPGVIVVGGVGLVLFMVVAYYVLWLTLAQWALFWVILPGGGAVFACAVVRDARLGRLRAAVLQAAHASLGPAPRSPWQ